MRRRSGSAGPPPRCRKVCDASVIVDACPAGSVPALTAWARYPGTIESAAAKARCCWPRSAPGRRRRCRPRRRGGTRRAARRRCPPTARRGSRRSGRASRPRCPSSGCVAVGLPWLQKFEVLVDRVRRARWSRAAGCPRGRSPPSGRAPPRPCGPGSTASSGRSSAGGSGCGRPASRRGSAGTCRPSAGPSPACPRASGRTAASGLELGARAVRAAHLERPRPRCCARSRRTAAAGPAWRPGTCISVSSGRSGGSATRSGRSNPRPGERAHDRERDRGEAAAAINAATIPRRRAALPFPCAMARSSVRHGSGRRGGPASHRSHDPTFRVALAAVVRRTRASRRMPSSGGVGGGLRCGAR